MKRHHQLLIELIELRDKDYDQFMEKLYDAITTDFEKVFKEELMKDKEHRNTLKLMIKYFENQEQYEKCNVLIHYLHN